tara:strand:+ start:2296 stop:3354 length:1059 start_codon:yes stop_codon:yes gene_type:complete
MAVFGGHSGASIGAGVSSGSIGAGLGGAGLGGAPGPSGPSGYGGVRGNIPGTEAFGEGRFGDTTATPESIMSLFSADDRANINPATFQAMLDNPVATMTKGFFGDTQGKVRSALDQGFRDVTVHGKPGGLGAVTGLTPAQAQSHINTPYHSRTNIGQTDSPFGRAVSGLAGFLPGPVGLLGSIANMSNNIRSGKGLLGFSLRDIFDSFSSNKAGDTPSTESPVNNIEPASSPPSPPSFGPSPPSTPSIYPGIEIVDTIAGPRYRVENQVFDNLQDAQNFRFSAIPKVQDPISVVDNQQVFTPDLSGYIPTTPGLPLSPEEREAALKLFRESIIAQQRKTAPVFSAVGAKSLL